MSPDGRDAPVRVMIFGEEYQIRTDLGEEYTRSCAKYVDDAIQEAHVGGHVAESHRAAILAALKITDELFRARRDRDELVDDVEARVVELTDRLESLADCAAPGEADAAELSLDV